MDVPAVEVFKVRLMGLRESLSSERCPSLWQRDWTRRSLKVPYDPNRFMIYDSVKYEKDI